MKRLYLAASVAVTIIVAGGVLLAINYHRRERTEQLRYEREETELIISNLAGAPVRLFKAGQEAAGAQPVTPFNGERIWLPRGNYFLQVDQPGGPLFFPAPIAGYRLGPDDEGALAVTIRPLPPDSPPQLSPEARFVHIPSGNFLFGDRQNLREPHYVWLPGYFMTSFEVSNAEFGEFVRDPQGYADESNWTEAGRVWKAANSSQASSRLRLPDAEFKRFGQPDQPVTSVTWFEAHAFCRWMTRKFGRGQWVFALPTEAEWEKAARGPDSFDYALGMIISDRESRLYNWRKNPAAAETVVGSRDSIAAYQPNRYGLYHLSGNVAEWTQSIHQPFNRERPYVDAERNRDDAADQRVVRGGSWYSASIALLYLSYRDAFQPGVSNHDLGFRIVARPLP
jgi:formylglycine-generating enzyme required for sulfatase activity